MEQSVAAADSLRQGCETLNELDAFIDGPFALCQCTAKD